DAVLDQAQLAPLVGVPGGVADDLACVQVVVGETVAAQLLGVPVSLREQRDDAGGLVDGGVEDGDRAEQARGLVDQRHQVVTAPALDDLGLKQRRGVVGGIDGALAAGCVGGALVHAKAGVGAAGA